MQRIIKEYLPYVVLIIIVILIRTFIITPVRVSGTSMDKTLTNGQILILYKLSDIKRDDIVVVDKKVQGSTLIKRLIALPGETIECINGKIFINDKEYDDKYAYGITEDFPKVELKEDEYFILGDNRIVSEDSRYFGPIKKKNIRGYIIFSLYPFNRFGKIWYSINIRRSEIWIGKEF